MVLEPLANRSLSFRPKGQSVLLVERESEPLGPRRQKPGKKVSQPLLTKVSQLPLVEWEMISNVKEKDALVLVNCSRLH